MTIASIVAKAYLPKIFRNCHNNTVKVSTRKYSTHPLYSKLIVNSDQKLKSLINTFINHPKDSPKPSKVIRQYRSAIKARVDQRPNKETIQQQKATILDTKIQRILEKEGLKQVKLLDRFVCRFEGQLSSEQRVRIFGYFRHHHAFNEMVEMYDSSNDNTFKCNSWVVNSYQIALLYSQYFSPNRVLGLSEGLISISPKPMDHHIKGSLHAVRAQIVKVYKNSESPDLNIIQQFEKCFPNQGTLSQRDMRKMFDTELRKSIQSLSRAFEACPSPEFALPLIWQLMEDKKSSLALEIARKALDSGIESDTFENRFARIVSGLLLDPSATANYDQWVNLAKAVCITPVQVEEVQATFQFLKGKLPC